MFEVSQHLGKVKPRPVSPAASCFVTVACDWQVLFAWTDNSYCEDGFILDRRWLSMGVDHWH